MYRRPLLKDVMAVLQDIPEGENFRIHIDGRDWFAGNRGSAGVLGVMGRDRRKSIKKLLDFAEKTYLERVKIKQEEDKETEDDNKSDRSKNRVRQSDSEY